MGITSTSQNAIRSMELYLNRFHHPTTGITRLHSNHGSSRPIHKNGTLYRSPDKRNSKRRRKCLSQGSLETSWSTHRNHIRHGRKILRRILGVSMQVARDQNKDVNSVPPTDGRSDGKNQPSAGRLLKQFRQLRTGRLVSAVTLSRIRIQQFRNKYTWNVTLLRELRLSSTDTMDERATSSESRG